MCPLALTPTLTEITLPLKNPTLLYVSYVPMW